MITIMEIAAITPAIQLQQTANDYNAIERIWRRIKMFLLILFGYLVFLLLILLLADIIGAPSSICY